MSEPDLRYLDKQVDELKNLFYKIESLERYDFSDLNLQRKSKIHREIYLSDFRKVPKEKLMSEVTAPYKQNWIGYFSLMIGVLSVIIIKFPELLEQPSIPFPDL